MGFFQQQQDFADGEQTQYQHDKLNAVSQVDVVAGEAVYATVGINPHAGQKQADKRSDKGFERTVPGHAAEADNGKHHEHEILRRAEGYRPLGQ